MSDDEIVPKIKHTYVEVNSPTSKPTADPFNRTLRVH
jgi:hypothetical protein